MKFKGYLMRVVLILLVVLFGSNGASASNLTSKQLSFWGIAINDAGGQGVSIQIVKKDSPGGSAGLLAGDILLSINGVAVRSPQEFREVKNTFPMFTPLNLLVKRKGAVIECKISLYGIVPLEVKEVKSNFIIPGVPQPPSVAVLSEIEALEQVNVLDQVIIEPQSGKLAIIGHYDARFNTGTIPYLDMLKTAMVYPKPKFNLGSLNGLTDAEKKSFEVFKQRLWDWPSKEFILAHPELEQERQQLIQLWAEACGLKPEELAALFNYVNFAAKEVVVPPDIRVIQSKILTNLGFGEAAQGYDLINQTGNDGPLKALQILGRSAEAQAILANNGADAAKVQGMMKAAAYLAIMEKIYASEALVINMREDLLQGRSTWQEVVIKAQDNLLPSRDSSNNREIIKLALNKIMLSAKGTKALFKDLQNVETVLDPVDLDHTSQLTRILYEADYSLKSLVVMPQLFRKIAGAKSYQEYQMDKGEHGPEETVDDTHHWLEPKMVAMTVSPQRRVVSFGLAQMNYVAKVFDDKGGAIEDSSVDHLYDEWCAGFVNDYDEYAHILPAFHKLREAAKIIALANWLIAEKLPLDLSGVNQEKWDAPDKVNGFWRTAMEYFDKGNGEYGELLQLGCSGGVTFKKSNWTQMTPAPTSETKVSDQLALSADLGQKAVVAAQGGNLENARYLAELSAQAMNGKLSKLDLTKQNIVVSEGKSVTVAPVNVQLQKEMLKKTYQQITVLVQNPSASKVTLNQLSSIYDQLRDKPASASEYLTQLQLGQNSPAPVQTITATKLPARGLCGESSLGVDMLPADRKEFLTRKMNEARDRLKYINEALRKLIAINANERAEIDRLTDQISQDFEVANERAYDFAFTTLIELPISKYSEVYEEKVKQMEYEIKSMIGKSTTPMSEAAREALSQDIKNMSILKSEYQNAFGINKKLLETYQGAGYSRDTYAWEQAGKQNGAWKKALDGAKLAGQILLDNPKLENFLSKQEWFGGNKLWQVVAMGKMASYGTGFFFDVLDLYGAWGPQAARMQKDLNYNTGAMENMRQKAERTLQEINCWERLLK